MRPKNKWSLFAIIVLLPVFVTGTTVSVSMSRTRDVTFCASCHVMEPYVADLHDPDSETLAARQGPSR